MISIRRRQLMKLGLGLAGGAILPTAHGHSEYPAKPLRLIHGFGAGGNADVVSRLMARQLAQSLGQPVVVEIKSGAGGRIASDSVAKAQPDGYTLVMLTGAHTVSAAMTRELPYDPVKDFSFLSTVSSFPFVIAVRADHPAKTLADLLALAASEPGRVTFTSVGVGSTQHMTGEILAAAANVKLLHVPYRGGGGPVEAVIAGDVDILSDTLTVAGPQIKAGRLRALAVTSGQAWSSVPDMPTVAQTLPGFEVRSWLGLAAPSGLPDAIVDRLNAAIVQALQADQVRLSLATLGSEPAPGNAYQMRSLVENEIVRWRGVVQTVKLSPV